MERTNNYDLKIYEGTDKFNPLLFENENMEIVDAAMAALQGLAIESATELKSSSVHAITRLNGESPLFRFTATSNWTAGDTMTIDGAQVSVFTPSGEALGTGSYVIGTEVIGAVIGTRVTLYVTSGAVAVAEDSEKLGGQLPEYYATKVQNELAMQTATAAGTLSEQNQQQINEINQKLTGYRRLLWSNPNPTQIFAGQDITLIDSIANYDEYEVTYAIRNEDARHRLSTGYIDVHNDAVLQYSSSYNTIRGINVNNSNVITVGNGTYYDVIGGQSKIYNNYLTPIEIYGIKHF